jgi:hypothetical protein
MPTTTATAPTTTGPAPNLTPAEFCGFLRVDEGGSIVISGCEENVRSIYNLEREQIDGGAWYSTAYGFEAPCNEQGTYRAEISSVHHDPAGVIDGYLFVIRIQGGYEFGGSMSIGYEATRAISATGSVQGNQCQFTICPAAECGILDTTQLSTVSGDGGAGGARSTTGGAGGRGGASSTGGRAAFPGF